MLHAGGAPAFLYCGPRPCAAALERCACRKAAGRACPAPTFYAGERFTPPRGVFRCHRRARSGQDRSLQTTRYRCIAGRDDRLSKKVCSPLGPLCEGAPPAGGGGRELLRLPEIFRAMAQVLSLRPFGAPPSQRGPRGEHTFSTVCHPSPRCSDSGWFVGSGLDRSVPAGGTGKHPGEG